VPVPRERARVTTLAEVVAALSAAGIECALIGAMALAARGVPRSTLDIDLLVMRPEALDRQTWAALLERGAPIEIRRGDASDPLEGIIRFRSDQGPAIDVVVGRGRWLLGVMERAEALAFAGTRVRVATAADLVLLKLYAGGPSDLWDIEQLLASEDAASLVAEIEPRLGELPAECSTLWRRLRAG
jgi:hypothetical protein